MTSKDTESHISSAGFSAGTSPCDSPGGMTQLELFGPPASPANPSPPPAVAREKRTTATSGRLSSPSSASVGLTSLLASKLQAALDTTGSTEYEFLSKRKATPSRLRIFRLVARGRHTGASASSGGPSGWPTPLANPEAPNKSSNQVNGPTSLLEAATLTGWPTESATLFGAVDLDRLQQRRAECKDRTGNGNGFGLTLDQAAPLWLSGWPTPRASEQDQGQANQDLVAEAGSCWLGQGRGSTLSTIASLSGWPTPQAGDSERASEQSIRGENNPTLLGAARMAGWATPTSGDAQKVTPFHEAPQPALSYQCHLTGWATPAARDYKGDSESSIVKGPHIPGGCRLPGCADLTSGATASPSIAGTPRRVASRLNPAFSLWLMGYPVSWSLCSPGWKEWDTAARLLADYYASPAATEPGD